MFGIYNHFNSFCNKFRKFIISVVFILIALISIFNVNNYGVVEDAHMSLMHIICQIIANKKDIIFDCQNK
mgnify:CR=1 FL=1